MLHRKQSDNSNDGNGMRTGCGPLIPSQNVSPRPLRQQVFEHIRAAGLCARIDVANNLNVSPASVTAITTDLLEAGYLEEITSTVRDGEPARGRPPVSIGVRAETFFVGGIYLGDVRNTAIIVDFGGNVIGSATIDHSIAQRSPETLIDDADKVLAEALINADIRKEVLSGIGLGMPGLIDTQSGMVVWSPLLDRRGINLRKLADEKFGIHVDIDNDANIVTLAELWFGKARAIPNFVVVTIEHGIGMGIVINHKLYRGALGLGMEFGHTKVQLDGALCRCGKRGCLEAYIADYALVREASTALGADSAAHSDPNMVLQKLFDEAKGGNEAARSIFRRAGRYLAVGLSNIVNIFDPGLVIISGERMQYDYLYAEEVIAEMETLTLDRNRKQPTIEINTWGHLIWAQGAAALALSTLTERSLGLQNEVAQPAARR